MRKVVLCPGELVRVLVLASSIRFHFVGIDYDLPLTLVPLSSFGRIKLKDSIIDNDSHNNNTPTPSTFITNSSISPFKHEAPD